MMIGVTADEVSRFPYDAVDILSFVSTVVFSKSSKKLKVQL